jgi:hypothetical protein
VGESCGIFNPAGGTIVGQSGALFFPSSSQKEEKKKNSNSELFQQ